MKIYNKLVRDNIPQIIKNDGKTCKTRILSQEEYVRQLNAKLQEEVAEYLQSGAKEELADIFEVVLALAIAQGCSHSELEQIRQQKVSKNGAFTKRIFLISVDGN